MKIDNMKASSNHTGDLLFVLQKRDIIEAFLTVEKPNRYVVKDGQSQTLLRITEQGEGIGYFLIRLLLRASRPFTLDARTPDDVPIGRFVRPWTWFFSVVQVFDGMGMALGEIRQRWSLNGRRYDLVRADGQVMGRLSGHFFRPWTFSLTAGGSKVGRVVKRFSGFTREMFTDADAFMIEVPDQYDESARLVLLGAALLVDFRHFEQSSG